MDIVDIIRVLLRRRLLVVAGIAVAVAIGVAAAGHLRTSAAPRATVQLLVGPPNATASTLDTITPDTLMMKAPLLADMLSTDELRASIARRARIASDQLSVMGPAFGTPTVGVPLALAGTEVGSQAGTPWVLVARADDRLPVITLSALGPTTAGTAKLIAAAGATLRDYVMRPVTRKRPGAALVVQQLGPVTTSTVSSGHPRILAVGAAIAMFVLWCCAIVVLSAAVRIGRGGRAQAAATTSS